MPPVSDIEKLILEARAKIIWGDSPASVATWLRSQNVDERRIQEVLDVALRERDLEIRRKGGEELIAGGAIFGIAVVLLIVLASVSGGPRGSQLFAALVVAAAYGVYRLVNGVVLLGRGASARGSVGSINND